MNQTGGDQRRGPVLLVGPSYRFASGLSAYTYRVSRALADDMDVAVILLRRLLPRRLYPGRARVGTTRVHCDYGGAQVLDGVDWFWFPSVFEALRFMRERPPQVVILEWWTVAVLHTYLLLAAAARRMGVPVVLEFHELQDPAEARLPAAAAANVVGLAGLLRLASAAIVHNAEDQALLGRRIGLGALPVHRVPHGPYDHLVSAAPADACGSGPDPAPTRLLFFGLIRPYKGLDDLLEAFEGLDRREVEDFTLTVVGETWEGWTAPAEAIARSRHRARIEFVNRYVSDEEVRAVFEAADALVLPYRRASSSGPLNIAMAAGLPVVFYGLPALVEAVDGYGGGVVVPPGDVASLRRALRTVRDLGRARYPAPRTWREVIDAYRRVIEEVAAGAEPSPGCRRRPTGE